MRRIWKYTLMYSMYDQDMHIPKDFTILSLQEQNNVPVMWINVETDQRFETIKFRFVLTGDDVPDNSEFVGTLQRGNLVYHLFRLSSVQDKCV